MCKIVEVKELEAVLKTETFSNVKLLHKLIFNNGGGRKNGQIFIFVYHVCQI